jgi:hypothetical protein
MLEGRFFGKAKQSYAVAETTSALGSHDQSCLKDASSAKPNKIKPNKFTP